MKSTNYFWCAFLMLIASINASMAQTYSLNAMTDEQFVSGGTDEWSFERHDVNAGTYSLLTTYGDSSTAVNFYDQYLTERFCLFPIMNRPSSGTQYETKRNAWFSSVGEYLYVAQEYPDGTTVGDLVYGSTYPDSLCGYEVYSISTGLNAAITFTVPEDGYYKADMKVMRQDLWSSIGVMKVYNFFRYGGTGTAYSMGKEFVYGVSQGIDTWAEGNDAIYAEYLAQIPESPTVNGNSGKPYRGLPTYSTSEVLYFYAHTGDKITFEADARSTGNTESTPRGGYARTKWLNLEVSLSDLATVQAHADKFANPYEPSQEWLDSLWVVLDLAEYILNEEGPANGYYQGYLTQLEALYTTISQRADDGVLLSMEIPTQIDQLWAAIDLARTPLLPMPVSGNYYVIKNYTTGTYIGGAGTGNDAVKHEDAATNPLYHIFQIEGDNDNGWTLKQQYTGNYITHNNVWTGSYAAANGSSRQLFQLDTSNPNYFLILKKKDDGTFANGIGFDSQTSGSTCFFDKGVDKWNMWTFDANDAKTILAEQIDLAVAEAQALYDNNSAIDGAAAVVSAIAAANAVKANAASTTTDLVNAITPLKNATQPLVVADQLRLAIADAQTTYTANATVNGAADFQTAINTAQAAYNASKTTYDATSLTQAITDLATAKAVFFLKIAEATGTVENPFDVTSIIVNPGFDENTATGWTVDQAGTASSYEYEIYNKTSFDFYQIITGLPVGQYKLTVQGFHRVGANSATLVQACDDGVEVIPVELYANENSAPLLSVYSDKTSASGWANSDGIKYCNSMADARTAFDEGKYTNNVVYVFVSDGTLQLGVKTTGTTQTSNWTIFDNFRLYYCGQAVSVTPYLTELQETYDAAKAYYDAILTADVAGASEGDVIGKYSYDKYTTLNTALLSAKTILDTDPSTLTAAQIGAAKTALLAAKAACVKNTGLNTLESGLYYILVNDQYYVTNPGNFDITVSKDYVISVALGSLLDTKNTSDNSQIIKITKQANGRYLFFSTLYEANINNSGPDGANYRNINENAAFRAEYSGDAELTWRTTNLLFDGTSYAIQNAEQSAAKGYWGYDADNQKITYGYTTPQYVFKFVATTGAGISAPTSNTALVYGTARNIRIVADKHVNVSVYSLTGTLIANNIISGTQDIPVQNAGLYIVKVNEKAVKVIVK